MAQGNVEVVRRMYEAFQAGDAEGALAHFDAQARIDTTDFAAGEAGTGREAVAAIIGRWIGGFEEWREEIEEIHDLGAGRVCAVATQRGRGRTTGIEVEARYAVLYEVRDGLIASMTLHRDLAEARRAAGLDDPG